MSVAAFFDLDRTLIDANSGLLWALHERKSRRISASQMLRAVVWSGLYHLSLVDIEVAMSEAVRHYRGVPWSDLAERTRHWFNAEISRRLRPGAAAAIAHHRQLGHPTIILTNASVFEARVASEIWGIDAYLANEFPVDGEGCLIGTLERPLCYGPGKVDRAEAWAREHEIDLDQSYFYSDSFSDLPMLERVGQPRVVSPDPRLRWAARRRRWEIVTW